MGNEVNSTFEFDANEFFNDMLCDDVIHAFLSNGYVLTLSPIKYNEETYAIMFEVGDKDESFLQFEV